VTQDAAPRHPNGSFPRAIAAQAARPAFCYTGEAAPTDLELPKARMRRLALLAAATLLLAPTADAVDVNDGQLAIHGDGAWSLQKTSNRNGFLDATPEGNYDTASFNLLLAVRPTPAITFNVYLEFDPDHTGVEWMFVEWRVSDRLRLRAGRVKQPIGNSGELVYAGTTRPFYDLAVSIYGPSNIAATAYLGAGATGTFASDSSWTLDYDLYAGALKLAELETYRALEVPADPTSDQPIREDRQQVRQIIGGRLSVTSPFDLTLRLSGYGGKMHKDETRNVTFLVTGLSAEYRVSRLKLGAELFYTVEVGIEHAVGSALEASWSFDEHWQVAARLEGYQSKVHTITVSSPLLNHREAALALDYWFTPTLVLKASAHRIVGNRFVYPDGASSRDLVTTPPAERTSMFLAGVQFAF
jgi:opacity protein-like surface antigen